MVVVVSVCVVVGFVILDVVLVVVRSGDGSVSVVVVESVLVAADVTVEYVVVSTTGCT